MTELLPHDNEAEQALLGAVIHDTSWIGHLQGVLEPEHFFGLRHRVIYQAMLELHEDRAAIDEITIGHRLRAAGNLDRVGGLAYVAELADMTPVASNAMVYAEAILEAWKAREGIRLASELDQSCRSKRALGQEAEDLARQLRELSTVQVSRSADSIQDRLVSWFDWFDAEGQNGGPRWQIGLLDDEIPSFDPRRLTTLGARTGVGKSAFVSQTVIRNAVKGTPTLYLDLEMPAEKLTARLLSSRANIDGSKLIYRKVNDLSEPEWDRLGQAAKELKDLPVWIYEPPRPMTTGQIETVCRRYIEQHGVGLVVIDQLSRIKPPKSAKNRNEEYDARIEGLAWMQQTLRVPVVIVHQINRDGADAPKLEHLYGSDMLAQNSTCIVLLHNPQRTDASGVSLLEAHIVKNDSAATRSGENAILLRWYPYRYATE